MNVVHRRVGKVEVDDEVNLCGCTCVCKLATKVDDEVNLFGCTCVCVQTNY